ncbi:protein mono-ADP-ribosyltransferase PARP12 [Periophthalmus magnuspinnatus]|uniref:protein mono-ADP-ribosyltransferase PARP12 n=1 Tax=Periophthalmus magnuspinnatus TaxID=409849 RepID=UPI00145A182C|nr:protein mono-ADP-ribosyltransferase PARP12 [Periophthalmus magnuspinnatus]
MAKGVSKWILEALCQNQGSLEYRSLNAQLSKHFTVAEETMRTIFFDNNSFAIEEGKEKASGAEIISPDSIIVAKTSARLCQNKTCQGCDNFHLCRYYVCGGCTFKDKCKNSHDLRSPQNAKILEKCDLQGLTEKQIFQLLLQNDPFLLPEICAHYNKGDGESGSCKFNTTCTKLHMCLHFLKGDCTFGLVCKRYHAIGAQGMKLFKQYSNENITGLYKIYRNKLIIQDQKPRPAPVSPGVSLPLLPKTNPSSSKQTNKPQAPTSPAPPKGVSESDREEICLFFVRRNCQYNERCVRVHWHLPYKWQMWEGESMTWKNMDDMENIEKAYCDPANAMSRTDEQIFRVLTLQSSSAQVVPLVDFIKMIYRGSPVRRLSTASSVSHPPHYILTTEWLWYWRDDGGAWVEYGQDGTGDAQASLSSQTLENIYLADKNGDIEFIAGSQKYKLYFKGGHGLQMYQQNLRYNTIREVRRRPRFVSAHDVEAKLSSGSSSSSQSSSSQSTVVTVPSNWDKKALPEIGYKLVRLSDSALEYKMIVRLFTPTMPQRRITSIKRIQNPSLWKMFQWQKEQMQKRNGANPVNEKHLFHGTDKSLVEAICEQNFDWRMCGVHGTAYGKGSYFARDASYSHKFAAGPRSKVMFVALVLVGDYTKGQSQYVRPPAKGRGTALYDSCVDDVTDPSIFVIFEKHQIYPEYIIKYT